MAKFSADLLRRDPVHKPTAAVLLSEFDGFLNYCDKVNTLPTKGLWCSYLNVTRDVYHLWKQDKVNQYLTDTEFNARLDIIKKIDDFLENVVADKLTSTEKNPAGTIFYLKNAFKWSDRQEPEVSLNLKIDGYNLPKSGDNKGNSKDI